MIGPEPEVERFFFLPNGSLAVYDPAEKKLVVANAIPPPPPPPEEDFEPLDDSDITF